MTGFFVSGIYQGIFVMKWTPCTKRPKARDVLRWVEPVLAPPTKKRGKREEIGTQQVTAKVLLMADVLELQVEALEIIEAPADFTPTIKSGDTIRRREASLVAGDCHIRSAD